MRKDGKCAKCESPHLNHSSYCGEHRREYSRNWMSKRRADYFKNKFCVDCGSKENLELDHIDPKLKISHAIWSWSEKRRLEEIAKCQVLCHDCHVNKSKMGGDYTINHRKSILSMEDINIINTRINNGEKQIHVAKDYNLSKQYINKIYHRAPVPE